MDSDDAQALTGASRCGAHGKAALPLEGVAVIRAAAGGLEGQCGGGGVVRGQNYLPRYISENRTHTPSKLGK